MIVDIDKIIVKDRIRKDFGDIQELADDIRKNGLINPPVVNKDYELLAGERRLRACKSLGWKQIEIRMMDTRDGSHDFDVEVSENETRKDFTKSEREAIYTKRVEEKLKKAGPIGPTVHSVEHEVAKEMGTSRTNMNREREVLRNKELLSPEDFADWDEGKLSTNKAFQKIKAQLAEKDRRIKALETDGKEREDYISQREEYIHELENREVEVKVIEKKVEVMPEDYEELKKRYKGSLEDYRILEDSKQKYFSENQALKRRIKDLEERKDIAELQRKLEEEAGYFAIRTYDYIQKNGGYVWITERMEQLPKKQRKEFIQTIYAIDAFAKQMVENIGGYNVE